MRPTTAASLLLGLALAVTPSCRRVENEPRRGLPTMSRVTPKQHDTAGQTDAPAPGTTVVVPDFGRIARKVQPSVVTVVSTVRREGAQAKTVRGLGSGMIVSAKGQVLTNEHVVSDASSVEVQLSTHHSIPAKIVFADPLLDLALLELTQPAKELVPVELGDRDPTPGEWVMAVGQPFGLGHTVTVGVVSGLGRDHGDLGRPPDLRSDGIWSFIQTDASINIGNSGGPLVDVDGRVVGITTAVRSDGQGLAFAIPAAMARRFLEEIWTYGRVRHARLGIRAETVGPGALQGRSRVVRITRVDAGGPGAKAGLEPGDFVLAINDSPVTRVSDVAYLSQLAGVGSRMSMTIKRGETPISQVLVIPAEVSE